MKDLTRGSIAYLMVRLCGVLREESVGLRNTRLIRGVSRAQALNLRAAIRDEPTRR